MPKLFTILLAVLATYGTTNVTFPNGKVLKVELAMTSDELSQGLSGRKVIPESGVLLVYKAPTRTRYHLMAYPAPVDIVYLDENKTVVNFVQDAMPCRVATTDCGYDSTWLHIYALQLPAGMIKQLNLHAGELLSFKVPETPPF